MFEELKEIKSGKKELREFGLTIGGILLIIGGIALWRGKSFFPYFLVIGGILFIMGIISPHVLKPLQKVWMGFSIVIGFFMSRLILTILFFAVITPIGILARLCGNDMLDVKIEKNKDSYWQEKTDSKKPRESYENQY